MAKTHLLVDTANLLFRTSSAHSKYSTGSPEDQAGLALHVALNTLKSHYNKVKPDVVALTFEGRNNWRKVYTKSPECVSQRLYKGNRVKDASKEAFYELMNNFESLVREHSSLICLSNDNCEGDDLFAAYALKHGGQGDKVMGLSGDRDFVQLLDIKNFTLLNPDKLGADRSLDKKGNPIDADYFMFEKAFRGDTGDNVMSAYPRVRSTRLEKAYKSEYELANILNEEWEFVDPSTGEKRMMNVGKLYHENQLLMNLRKQPDHIKKIMFEAVDHAEMTENQGKFSLFHFSKFCGKWNLKKIADDVTSYAPLFSNQGFIGSRRIDASEAPKPEKKPGLVIQEDQELTEQDKRNMDIMERLRNKSKSKAKNTLTF